MRGGRKQPPKGGDNPFANYWRKKSISSTASTAPTTTDLQASSPRKPAIGTSAIAPLAKRRKIGEGDWGSSSDVGSSITNVLRNALSGVREVAENNKSEWDDAEKAFNGSDVVVSSEEDDDSAEEGKGKSTWRSDELFADEIEEDSDLKSSEEGSSDLSPVRVPDFSDPERTTPIPIPGAILLESLLPSLARPVCTIVPTVDDLHLQVLECEDASRDSRIGVLPPLKDAAPSIRIVGCTPEGHSVCLWVEGFYPHIFFPVSPTFTQADISTFTNSLRTASGVQPRKVELCKRKPLMYYRPGAGDKYDNFLRVEFHRHPDVAKASRALESCDGEGERVASDAFRDLWSHSKLYDATVYESNISPVLRFLVATRLSGGSFCTLPRGSYRLLSGIWSRCSVSAAIHWSSIKARTAEEQGGRWGGMVGWRMCAISVSEILEEMENQSDSSDGKVGTADIKPILGATLASSRDPLRTPPNSDRARAMVGAPPGAPKKVKATATVGRKRAASPPSPTPGSRPGNGHSSVGANPNQRRPTSNIQLPASTGSNGLSKAIGAVSLVFTTQHTDAPSAQPASDFSVVFTHRGESSDSALKATDLPRHEGTSAARSYNVMEYSSESAMLNGLRDAIIAYDPDILGGWDAAEEIVTVVARAKKLGVGGWSKLGRLAALEIKVGRHQIYGANWVRAQRRMAGTNNRAFAEVAVPGRLILDLRQIVERDERLRSYSFAEVVQTYLGRTKETLTERQLTQLFRNGERERGRFLKYVAREGALAVDVGRKGAHLVGYVEMARVTGLNIAECFQRGQMPRFWSQLCRYCREKDVVIPTSKDRNDSGMTEGPLNYMPETGLNTTEPCAVLDFRSLYPSIIIAHNLSYDTLLKPEDRHLLHSDEWEPGKGPQECYFVKSNVKKGIVPEILEAFLAERKKVKKQMAETSDAAMKIVLNGRQTALKVCANAIYGFTGAKDSKLQCLPIAESTILFGAEMLERTKQEIELKFRKTEGFDTDARVIYGDTDSVFVKFPDSSVGDAIRMSKKISDHITTLFEQPIALEFQKVYFPFIMLNRKRYAGREWNSYAQPAGVDAKGVESQRRDSCPLLAKMMTNVFEMLLPPTQRISDRERYELIEKSKGYVKDTIRKMLEGRYDMSEFIITKGFWLGTEAESYKSKQAHVELAERMRKREPWRSFEDGERISYVFVQAAVGAKGHEKSEDPIFAVQNGVSLDYQYYLRHQLENQLKRIFELIIPPSEVTNLFNGAHTNITRTRVSTTVKPKPGAITSFFGKSSETASCMVCRARIAAGRCVCDNHVEELTTTFAAKLEEQSEIDIEQARVQHQCRQCQGSFMRDVLCINGDCTYYYRRLRANQERERLNEEVERLESAREWQIEYQTT
ncbi:hypothetical protein M427DRAFT_399532 [Gonapodya prolifera JEL478]|uniref:DNA polymerase n=1 Tax=Gonapodya prolifera (strain JEL478) TaxID=1344416 RepID=A0A139ATC9_GONPJ|nr:hypothetical protein M427DRAFT_399532 [Gonapodya prolifera JEL478]|eukprot:KXS19990.1 hypothetical protein M427DRAFT_399532 [Gonapodya prolifera JEL478]